MLILLLTPSARRAVNPIGWIVRVIAFVFVGMGIYALSTVNSMFANGLTLLATLLVAFMALQSFRQTANLETRRANEAILKEIMEWTVEIQNVPWQPFSPEMIRTTADPSKLDDANIIIKYGAVATKNDYMRKVSEKAFNGRLKKA